MQGIKRLACIPKLTCNAGVYDWSRCLNVSQMKIEFPIMNDYPRITLLSRRSYSSKKRKSDPSNSKRRLIDLLKPTSIPAQNIDSDATHVGTEMVGPLDKDELINMLNSFYRSKEAKQLALLQGMDHGLFLEAFSDFRRFCAQSDALSDDLHIVLSDILQGQGSPIDIFPYFLRHARKLYPHLECLDDLRKVSDLTQPASWFSLARSRQRKIVIHAGPTNSGKTHHAFQSFLQAKSGIYCGPLKLLATEIYNRSNSEGVPCDLVTGEERRFADPEEKVSAAHVSCTVEMTDLQRHVEVAIIDEIQMLRDSHRGWAWTRAVLGVNADEVHLCGEGTAIDIIKEMSLDTGDEVEVRRYNRLTPIEYLREPLGSFNNVQPGDCIVCFSKNAIYQVTRELEKMNIESAVIYGSLPSGTKLAQAAKFNNPDDPCKVLVATDAIGMGLNLNIRRVIFYSLTKMTENVQGEKEMDLLTASQALQIAGRCGRFGTTHSQKGYVTTFLAEDVDIMHDLLNSTIEPIEHAGLHPTAEQIELFSYHLPDSSLSNLIDIFVTLSTVDMQRYFLCNIEPFKQLADIIDHVPLALRTRYVFCCAPIPLQSTFVTSTFLKFARRFSKGEVLDLDWLGAQIGWPFKSPRTVTELNHLEAVHDVLDLYQWLAYRFQDQFPDRALVKDMQSEIDELILIGVDDMTKLIYEEQNDQLKNTKKNKDKYGNDVEEMPEGGKGLLSTSRVKRLKSKVSKGKRPFH